jgi:hypothetical protein
MTMLMLSRGYNHPRCLDAAWRHAGLGERTGGPSGTATLAHRGSEAASAPPHPETHTFTDCYPLHRCCERCQDGHQDYSCQPPNAEVQETSNEGLLYLFRVFCNRMTRAEYEATTSGVRRTYLARHGF